MQCIEEEGDYDSDDLWETHTLIYGNANHTESMNPELSCIFMSNQYLNPNSFQFIYQLNV